MKKYLSLVLTICIVLGCVSLISCNFEGIFGKTSSTESTEPTPSEPTQPTEPTSSSSSTEEEPQPEPEELVFEHGDNFTEDDIEFVKSLQGRRHFQNVEWNNYTIGNVVDTIPLGLTLFLAEINVDEPYYICAYLDNTQYYEHWKYDNYYMPLDVALFEWYKFYDIESISQTINEHSLVWSFAVCDCKIVKDAINNIPYDYQIKYYVEYGEPNGAQKILNEEKILIRASKDDFSQDWFKYRNQEVYSNTFYYLYTDEFGQEYAIFLNKRCTLTGEVVLNYAEKDFGSYYKSALSYFVSMDHFNYEIYDSIKKENCIDSFVGIKLTDLLLIEKEVESGEK